MENRLKELFPKLQKIGIFGSGISGMGCAHLCEKLGISYEIVDEARGGCQKPHFERYDLCVFSPGFKPTHPWIQWVYKQKIPFVNEIDFAALQLKNPIIAVTGTNGKTSVTEALTQLLCFMGKPAYAVGNNGNVLSEVVAKDILTSKEILVCEISSYQAWLLRYLKPIYTLWTNIAEDHMSYHGDFKHYFASKRHLLDLTQKFIFCGPRLKQYFKNDPRVIFSEDCENLTDWFSKFPVCFSKGQCENFSLLKTFSEKLGIPQQLLDSCLKNFRQCPHRLYCCFKNEKYEFWNDSKGTNLHAVEAALESLKHKENVYWILGGKSKEESLEIFPKVLNRYSNVKKIFLIGETGKALFCKKNTFNASTQYTTTLEGVFSNLKQDTPPFVVVLSPGFSSWDQFSSYTERGNLFENLAYTFSC